MSTTIGPITLARERYRDLDLATATEIELRETLQLVKEALKQLLEPRTTLHIVIEEEE